MKVRNATDQQQLDCLNLAIAAARGIEAGKSPIRQPAYNLRNIVSIRRNDKDRASGRALLRNPIRHRIRYLLNSW